MNKTAADVLDDVRENYEVPPAVEALTTRIIAAEPIQHAHMLTEVADDSSVETSIESRLTIVTASRLVDLSWSDHPVADGPDAESEVEHLERVFRDEAPLPRRRVVTVQARTLNLSKLASVELAVQHAPESTEVTGVTVLALSATLNQFHVQPAECPEDPACAGDHGYVGRAMQDNLHLGMGAPVHSPQEISGLLDFGVALAAAVSDARP